jgi:hypothetical protein
VIVRSGCCEFAGRKAGLDWARFLGLFLDSAKEESRG